MSKFEDIAISKTSYEGPRGAELDRLKINLADTRSNEVWMMSKILHNQAMPNHLPDCQIDLNPKVAGAARLLKALDRRGFEVVDIDRENGTISIARELDPGDMFKLQVRRKEKQPG